MLTQRPRTLERDGPVVPPRVEHGISDLGRGLAPLSATLAGWATANLPRVEQNRAA